MNSNWSSEGHVDKTKSIAEDTVPTRKGSILEPIKKVLAEMIVVKHPESSELLCNEQMLMHLSKVGPLLPFLLQIVCFPFMASNKSCHASVT